MLRALINLPLWVRVLAGIVGLAFTLAAVLGYFGRQPLKTIGFMSAASLLAISQLADLRPEKGNGRSARLLRISAQILVALVVFGWVFVVGGLLYVYMRRGTIWLED